MDSNLPDLEDVIVTDMASCPPPTITWSNMGDRTAAFTGRSGRKVFMHFKVAESKIWRERNVRCGVQSKQLS